MRELAPDIAAVATPGPQRSDRDRPLKQGYDFVSRYFAPPRASRKIPLPAVLTARSRAVLVHTTAKDHVSRISSVATRRGGRVPPRRRPRRTRRQLRVLPRRRGGHLGRDTRRPEPGPSQRPTPRTLARDGRSIAVTTSSRRAFVPARRSRRLRPIPRIAEGRNHRGTRRARRATAPGHDRQCRGGSPTAPTVRRTTPPARATPRRLTGSPRAWWPLRSSSGSRVDDREIPASRRCF